MITISNISKRFGKLKALDQLNLQFQSGECIALIGPNGSGKTTLIKSILGMVVPDEGSIFFNSNNIHKDWKYRSQIGYMPQIGRYPDNMTIGQVIGMMKDIRKSEKCILDEELIEKFGLQSIMHKRMRTLSGGTRQKVSASLAFLFNADVLILDEPTAGLDPVSSEILKEKILKEKSNGKLIIITSHVLSELDDVVTQVVYMQDGKLKFQKEIEALKKETGEEKLSKSIAKIMLQNQL
jgi:Cu-processing system ATP-binding protein